MTRKLAVIGRYYNKQGGVSNVMAQLATRAVAAGHDLSVFSHEYLDWDIEASRVPCAMVGRPHCMQTPTFAVSVARRLQRSSFDLVHCHDAQAMGADVYTAHSCFPAYIRDRRAAAGMAKATLSRLYPPHVIGSVTTRLGFTVNRPLVVSVSTSVRDELVELGILDPEDVKVIHNGVDMERFSRPDRQHALSGLQDRVGKPLRDKILAVFVGYEFDRKRLGVAIEAVAANVHHDVELVVAGKGDSHKYRQLASDLGVADRVHFLGHCSNVEEVLAACEVFIMPTKYEAASLAILEAAAAGLAVITTDVAMAAEVFVDGESARLLPNTDDSAPAATALGQLLDSRATRHRIAAGGRAVAANFGWDAVWRRYEDVYEEAADRRARRAA